MCDAWIYPFHGVLSVRIAGKMRARAAMYVLCSEPGGEAAVARGRSGAVGAALAPAPPALLRTGLQTTHFIYHNK